jgi:DNA-binding HxlR family transcriptional regulator
MREYGQYCPVSLASEVIADRWTPLILREMVLGSTRFNDIERGLPGISRTLLSQRLRHLERKGIVELRPAASGRGSEYHLTPAGQDLEPVLMSIGEWAVRWMFAEPEVAQTDPVTLTWWMHRRVVTSELPDERVVIEFAYKGRGEPTTWMVIDRRVPSVCVTHPGFDPDLVVDTDALSLTRVFSGVDTLREAIDAGAVRLLGPPRLARGFARWFAWSPFAPSVRRAARAHARQRARAG